MPSDDADLCFASPDAAVAGIAAMVAGEDWTTLGRYVVATADVDPTVLASGAWFIQEPAPVGPPIAGLGLRYPFSPWCRATGVEVTGDEARVSYVCQVVLGEEEVAPGRIVTKQTSAEHVTLRLLRGPGGWRISPEVTSGQPGPIPDEVLAPPSRLTDDEVSALLEAMSAPSTAPLGRDATIFRKVRACLDNLAGGSGHLGSYLLDPDSFVITGSRELEPGLTEYRFDVLGALQTERLAPHTGLDGPERLAGSVVLDADLSLALDADGAVRIAPWRCLDPRFWSAAARRELPPT